MENLPKHAWILCVRHNLLLAELCALRARCLLFQMLSIIVSTPSGSFKADRLYLFLNLFCCVFSFFFWGGGVGDPWFRPKSHYKANQIFLLFVFLFLFRSSCYFLSWTFVTFSTFLLGPLFPVPLPFSFFSTFPFPFFPFRRGWGGSC